MRKHFYCFIKKGKTFHMMDVPDMTEQEYEQFSTSLKTNKEYIRYRKKADDVFIVSEQDDEYIIMRYYEIRLGYIAANCKRFDITDVEKEYVIGLLYHLTYDEIADLRGGSASTVGTQFGRIKDKLHKHKQKANTPESMLRVLMRKPKSELGIRN